ncbi:hypothetical protein ACTXGQ_16605 [Marinobacter sp. 1Y8]
MRVRLIQGRCFGSCYRLIAIAGLLLATTGQAFADDWHRTSLRLDNAALDQQRGGFSLGGLEIAIGLEQVVSVNGETLIVNRLTIPNLNQRISNDLAQQYFEVAQITTASQGIVPALVTSNLLLEGGWFTHIQNSLDQTVIQNIRSLNIELNNVGVPNNVPSGLLSPYLQTGR